MAIKPYNEDEAQVEQIRKMFNNIAHRYDLLNQLISFGTCNMWRRKLIKILSTFSPKNVLDIATGTGDLAIDIVKNIPSVESVTGTDISEEMMRVGAYKVNKKNLNNKIKFQTGDASNLPFEKDTFDAVTISFGIRNFSDLDKSVEEVYRVLKSGGVFIFIELTEPVNKLMLPLYKTYTRYIMPHIGRLISGDPKAYKYLPESISQFPSREKLVKVLESKGFENSFFKNLPMGTATIYFGLKP